MPGARKSFQPLWTDTAINYKYFLPVFRLSKPEITKMKAIRVRRTGGSEVLEYVEVPVPAPSPNQALVKIGVIGVNFIDVYFRKGLYPSKLPFTPGMEAAGIVETTGSEVSGFKAGDRVAYAGCLDSYAEYVAVPASRLVKVPEGIDLMQAASAMLQGMTAHYLSRSVFPLEPSDTVLVHAAAGGVGLLLVQMLKERGCRVIGTVSTEEKAGLAMQAGADHVINYAESDFEVEVKKIAEKGVRAVYDSVGLTTFEKSINCLAPRGCMVLFGQSSGPVPAIDSQVLSRNGSLFLTRPSLQDYVATREELLGRADAVFDGILSGRLKLRIGETFKLSEASVAHDRLEGRMTTGKVILIP